MVVQHNISSMNANRYYNINNSGLSKSLEKLSSGYQINRAGDNAAGLAVSEKMRSQIGGLTQGVKNAQDGISMIQTFEGALTETDSILQRMKTLADQAANGTYQDDVDREAIQLEFDQLNDELDQIADTDFNGVIMLNGGTMADGLRAESGKFDYANRAKQAAEDAAAKPIDIYSASNPTTTAKRFNTVDDVNYDNDAAKQLWEDAGLDASTSSIDVTFKVKSVDKDTGAVTYEIASATTDKGESVATTAFGAPNAVNGDDTLSGHGGFKFGAGGTDNVNVIFDATNLKVGDTITINLTGPSAGNVAPTNGGIVDGSVTLTNSGAAATLDTNPSVEMGAIKDADMTEDIKAILDALTASDLTATISETNKTLQAVTDVSLGAAALTAGKTTIGGKDVFLAVDGGALVVSTLNDAGNAADKTIAKINFGELSDAPGTGKSSTVKLKVAFDEYSVATGASKPEATAKASAEIPAEKKVSESDSFDQSITTLTYTDKLTLQAGARTKDSVQFTFEYASKGLGKLKANMDCSSREGGLNTKSLSLLTQKDANAAIDQIDNAINKVSMVRATFGATQNRLEHKIDNMNVTKENITSAESRIRDTDVSEEMANFTKNQILSQASQSMLAQANSLPQNVLQLLG